MSRDLSRPDFYSFGVFTVDVQARQLFQAGAPVALPCKAFDTLLALLQHRDRVIGKDELIALIWPNSFVSDDSLAQCVSVLRRALGDASSQPLFIATVPRRGYKFVSPVIEQQASIQPSAPAPLLDAPELEGPVAQSDALRLPLDQHPATRPVPAHPRLSVAGFLAALTLVTVALVAHSWGSAGAKSLPPQPIRFTQDAPAEGTLVAGGVISPDGRTLAFLAQHEDTGQSMLWLRELASLTAKPIEGTEGAMRPFWSPDSRFIAFFSGYRLRRVGLDGNPPTTLLNIGMTPTGGAWSATGVILFGGWRSGLFTVPASGGGTPERITSLDATHYESAHRAPQFLPDGRHFLYYVASAKVEHTGTYLGELGSSARTRVLDIPATYAKPGFLLFSRDRTLLAQPFDVSERRLSGTPIAIAGNLGTPTIDSGVSASDHGVVTYGGTLASGHLTWFNRTGGELSAVEAPTELHAPQLIPEQNQLIANASDGIWLIDLERGASTRLGIEGAASMPSRDGRHVVYSSGQMTGVSDLYITPMDGNREGRLVLKTSEPKTATDWSIEGEVVFVSRAPSTKNDIWLLPASEGKARPFLQTPANEIQARISPNGRWIAYASDESGVWEVYLQAFPMGGSKRTLSVGGGTQPQWRADGRELFYLDDRRRIMAVSIGDGNPPQAGRPAPLFRVPIMGSMGDTRNHFAVSADGTRFLVDTIQPDRRRKPIAIILNWTSLLAN